MDPTSDCGHVAVTACACVSPAIRLCRECFQAHVMTFSHPKVKICRLEPVVPAPHHILVKTLIAEFDSIMNSLIGFKVKVLHEVKVSILRVQKEIAAGRHPDSYFARAVLNNSVPQAFKDIMQKVVEQAERQTELFLSFMEGASLHVFTRSSSILNYDHFANQWQPAVSLTEDPLADDFSFWLSLSNFQVFLCNPKPQKCAKVDPKTGEVWRLKEMMRKRRLFGACVDEQDRVLAIGGDEEGSAEVYNEARKLWILLEGQMKYPRWSFQPVTHRELCYLIGGSHPSVEIRNLRNWSLVSDFLYPFDNLSTTTAMVVNQNIIIVWGSTKRTTDLSFANTIDVMLPPDQLFTATQTVPVLSQGTMLVLLASQVVLSIPAYS